VFGHPAWYCPDVPVTPSFREFLVDQLAGLGEVTVKRMFGGLGLYSAGLFFAIVDDDTLFFRVDDATRPDFVARGMSPFRPVRSNPKKVSENYYQCPAEVLEDSDEVCVWAKRAVRAAASPTAAKVRAARVHGEKVAAAKAKPRSARKAAKKAKKRGPSAR
jgi:DNA transformation protein and related proteins